MRFATLAALLAVAGYASGKLVVNSCGCMPGQVCRIECDEFNGYCSNTTVVCPPGSVECEFLCHTEGSSICHDKTFVCQPNIPCAVVCSGKESCSRINVTVAGNQITTVQPEVRCLSPSPCADIKSGRPQSCSQVSRLGKPIKDSELVQPVKQGECESAWKSIGIKLDLNNRNGAITNSDKKNQLLENLETDFKGLFPASDNVGVNVQLVCDVNPTTNYKGNECYSGDTIAEDQMTKMGRVFLDTEVTSYKGTIDEDVNVIGEALRYAALGRGPLVANGKKFPAPMSYDDGPYIHTTQSSADGAAAYDAEVTTSWSENADKKESSDGMQKLTIVLVTAVVTACIVGLVGAVVVVKGRGRPGNVSNRRPPDAHMSEMLGKEHLPFLMAAEEAEMDLAAYYMQHKPQVQSPLSARSSDMNNREDCMSRSSSGASLSMICQTLATPPRRQIVGASR
eukprot:TRINITY_DN2310_c0_g7_i1.p1 TRINITY_DN2310_c0_g7~~TRINITY_DN2310_c0_g7_i1.p1  ORF type:complete len:453 (+),score=158.80 TRINITY_DN2310_c0_g7_i1:369-1727(+)